MNVFVVIPAYNEEEKIGPVVRDIFSLYQDFKIIVVDDGSVDDTAKIAKEAGADVLRFLLNRGQGASLSIGTDYAVKQGADIIIHFDADGQFEPKEIKELVKPIINQECEVILGSRFLNQNLATIPWSKKYFLLPVARIVNFLFTGQWLTDAHNGFRILSRKAAQTIKITQDRMAHNSDIVSQIRKYKLTFKELPVTVYYEDYGQGISGGIKIIKDLLLQKFY